MSDAIRNATWQELDALAAHDRQLAADAARARVEAVAHWLVAHGFDHFETAEMLQDVADIVVTAKGLAA